MVYYSIDLSVWSSLPRDAAGCKWLSSTSFKTEATYGRSAVIFPTDVEQMIDQYVQYFRPVLAKKRPDLTKPESVALFLTAKGGRMIRLSNDIVHVFESTQNKRINITTLRKMLNSEATMHMSPEDLAALQRNDEHSDATSRVHYEKLQSYDVAAKGAKLQAKLLSAAASRYQADEKEEVVMAIELDSGDSDSMASVDTASGSSQSSPPMTVASASSSLSRSPPPLTPSSSSAAAAAAASSSGSSSSSSSSSSVAARSGVPVGKLFLRPPTAAASSPPPRPAAASSHSSAGLALPSASIEIALAATNATVASALTNAAAGIATVPMIPVSGEKDDSPPVAAAATMQPTTDVAVDDIKQPHRTKPVGKSDSRHSISWSRKQDQAILAHAQMGPDGSRKKISLRTLLAAEPELFAGLTSQRIQWRYKNLAIQDERVAGYKRKRNLVDSGATDGGDDPNDEWYVPPAVDSPTVVDTKKEGRTSARRGNESAGSPSNCAKTDEPDRVLTAKVLNKKMYCRVRWVNYPTKPDSWEVWKSNHPLRTSASWLNRN